MSCVAALCLLALLVACGSEGPSPAEPTTTGATTAGATLAQRWASGGETVAVEPAGADAEGVRVVVAGREAAVTSVDGRLAFVVPRAVPAGPQPVEIRLGGRTLRTTLDVLGDDLVPGEFTLVVEPGTAVEELTGLLDPLLSGPLGSPFAILEGPRPLGAAYGPCSGEIVRIGAGSAGAGRLLGLLKLLEAEGTVWHVDPVSAYDPDALAGAIDPDALAGAIDHLAAIGAVDAHRRGRTGAGAVIAVLDTGVSPHEELGARLLAAHGYDFADDDADPADAYGSAGHGTPVAVLAAGSSSGVAPGADVLPIRVCDEDGACDTGDVARGLCHALTTAEEELTGVDDLVLNLSFGGETPNGAIRAILDHALENGALVAAAGGNRGLQGSPPHYPAASGLDGVVAVAALQAGGAGGWSPAATSTRGGYLDVAAPGVDLTSGDPAGGYRSGFDGTSFATPLVAGALALWREAHPDLAPADVEAGLEASARALVHPATAVGAGLLDLSGAP